MILKSMMLMVCHICSNYLLQVSYIVVSLCNTDTELWVESSNVLEREFPEFIESLNNTEDNALHLDEEDEALIWWTIGLFAALERIYSLPSKAIGWILCFVLVLFYFGGLYCHRLHQIADIFPTTSYQKNCLIKKRYTSLHL